MRPVPPGLSFARPLAGILILLLALLLAPAAAALDSVALADLPPEARQTLALIKSGGPFPYRRDGVVFGNFERRLPLKPRGYYREYTVPTPRLRHRGARRIVTGDMVRAEYYYTHDHYRSFRRIEE